MPEFSASQTARTWRTGDAGRLLRGIDAEAAERDEDEDITQRLAELAAHQPSRGCADARSADPCRRTDGFEILETVLRLTIELRSTRDAARAALDVALARRLSVYDAYYCVLPEALDAPLVTAYRRLAEAAPRAELIA